MICTLILRWDTGADRFSNPNFEVILRSEHVTVGKLFLNKKIKINMQNT